VDVTYAAIRRQQRREGLKPVEFLPVNWQPQVKVRFTRDVNGWLNRDLNVKWHFAAGSTHMVDEQHAIEFIVKGYAVGELPRDVSADERAEIRSVITTIGLGEAPQTREQ
jgi:hypothetical protein